ncbi:MAG: glutamate 5-kinase [Gammaproteobacteria bacterium]|nr:glutamate 5-kinase [Gammaproteobacteria bacterium]NNJ51341.1 glutamate 5-kinase [Gammaproteobacteria bacterium]
MNSRQTTTRKTVAESKRWVIKISSALITNDGQGLNHQAIQSWAHQIAALRESGKEILLVSSGAVAEGMARLGWKLRPHALHELQAAAALGQMGLVQNFESCFKQHDIHTAQVLLTHEDLGNRQRYLNARSTLKTLLSLGAIPIINENDTVATDEIRFGDNDTLGALVSNLVEADTLILLTDQQGLYDEDPRFNKDAELVSESSACNSALLGMAGDGGALGQGGMRTKVTAAQRAARSGANTIIASGAEPDILNKIARGENVGTLLTADREPMSARKQWLANQLKIAGRLHLDAGASQAVQKSGVSLLAVGVNKVEGNFQRGEVVSCISSEGDEIARGLVNYDSKESRQLQGMTSEKFESILGYVDEAELIHRDNLVLL